MKITGETIILVNGEKLHARDVKIISDAIREQGSAVLVVDEPIEVPRLDPEALRPVPVAVLHAPLYSPLPSLTPSGPWCCRRCSARTMGRPNRCGSCGGRKFFQWSK